MYYTGFADEAANDIYGQIKATKQLGWNCIESRNVNGIAIGKLSDDDFDKVVAALEENDVRVNCIGSPIANWGCSIDSPFEQTIDEVKTLLPRMKRLNTDMIRIMSYGIMQDCRPDMQQEQERFRRVRIIKDMFDDAGITAVHENCMNYGGMSPEHMLRLIDNVPGLKIVFDTGNPVFTFDYSKPKPYPKQSSWEFYNAVKEHIAYIHIKDGIYVSENEGAIFPKCNFTWPGEGDGDVVRILEDLLSSGYDGGISIEPHLSKVFHEAPGQTTEDMKFSTYLEYGRRVMRIVEEVLALANSAMETVKC